MRRFLLLTRVFCVLWFPLQTQALVSRTLTLNCTHTAADRFTHFPSSAHSGLSNLNFLSGIYLSADGNNGAREELRCKRRGRRRGSVTQKGIKRKSRKDSFSLTFWGLGRTGGGEGGKQIRVRKDEDKEGPHVD